MFFQKYGNKPLNIYAIKRIQLSLLFNFHIIKIAYGSICLKYLKNAFLKYGRLNVLELLQFH